MGDGGMELRAVSEKKHTPTGWQLRQRALCTQERRFAGSSGLHFDLKRRRTRGKWREPAGDALPTLLRSSSHDPSVHELP